MADGDHSDVGPSAFGGTFDLQDFYRAFRLDEITPENMQRWPYYRHVSAHWPDFVQTGTQPIPASPNPRRLTLGQQFDLNAEFRIGKSYLQSLVDTQAKGFVVVRNDEILAEFYANGFNLGDRNLLQSASKTMAGVVTHQLIDSGLLDASTTVESVLDDFAGTTIGVATLQQVLDMSSGARQLLDFHNEDSPDYQWEVEIGLKGGAPKGHIEAIRSAERATEPGAAWNYTDKNTDALALIAERASGRSYVELVTELFDAFGANDSGSIAISAEGTAAPSYGISLTTRDYALFHQWLARHHAPASYYTSAMDTSKDLIRRTNVLAAEAFPGTTYGSQTYFITDQNALHSSGSYGQIGVSDMESGIAVVVHSDWANNAEPLKFEESRARAVAIINSLR